MNNDKMGGAAAVLTGLLSGSFVVLTVIGSPAAVDGLLPRYAVLADYALALAGLAGLAAVPALAARLSGSADGWMGWTTKVGLLGFALLAVVNFGQAETDLISGQADYDVPAGLYGAINEDVALPGTEPELAVDVLLARSPHGWLEVAGIGLWILTVSWLSLNAGVLPSGLAGTGVAAAFLSFCAAAGANLSIPVLHLLGTLGWSLVLPVWFVWAGAYLLVAAQEDAAEPAVPTALAFDERVARAPEPPRRKRRSAPLIRLWPN